MPETHLVLYREEDGEVPIALWLNTIPRKASKKCILRIERLKQLGHELRRPEADYIRDGIYELRIAIQGIQYRILYFFHEQKAVVLSHGIIKEQKIPMKEIEYAIQNKIKYLENPEQHSTEFDLS